MRKVAIFSVFIVIFICLTFTPTLAKAKKVLLEYDFDNCKRISKQPECECSNGVRCIDGVKGRALAFLGRGDFIKEAGVPQGSFTVSFWMRTVERGADEQQGNFYGCTGLVDASGVGKGSGWGVSLCGDRVGFGVGDTTITSKSSVTTGRWRFIVATRDLDTDNIKLYINGKLEAEMNGVVQVDEASETEIYIGASHQLKGAYYFGSLDELKIYGRALSADEIKKIYEKYNPYKIQIIQVTKREEVYEEEGPEKNTDIERRPSPRPRMSMSSNIL